MQMQVILSDYNCIGQAETIFRILRYQGYTALAAMELVLFRDIGLHPSTDDEIVWQLCQTKGYLLLTGNRTASDKNKSLEFVVRRLLTPTSLPIITISNLKRISADYAYCERCAARLTEIVLDLDNLRGTPRLFIPGQASNT